MTVPRMLRAGLAAVAGLALVAAPAAAQTVANDFSIALGSAQEAIEPGQSAKVNVETRVTGGAAQQVALRAGGLPAGASATFTPAAMLSGDWATLLITTTAATPEGTARITITADGADVDRTVEFTLVVGDGEEPPGCGGLTPWSATTAYTPGQVVSHNGHRWESTWYSTGAVPGAPGSWAAWKDLGAC
ncbi:carbohydrate-binding protein [Actinokineospora sp. NPDC004072]